MPGDAHADAMNETLTPQEAARVLTKARSWEDALEGRTAGITWMIWGIATPGIFVTYGFVPTPSARSASSGVMEAGRGVNPRRA